jgi:hypothetical protein
MELLFKRIGACEWRYCKTSAEPFLIFICKVEHIKDAILLQANGIKKQLKDGSKYL